MADTTPDDFAAMFKAVLQPDPSSTSETLQSVFAKWRGRYEKNLKEERDEGYAFESCLLVGERAGCAILSWCEQHNETPSELSSKLYYVKEFVTQLYDALAPQDGSSNKQRYSFWRHVDMTTVIQRGKRSYREQFLDRQSLKNLADVYLARPWMHNAYLDWVFADALIAGELVATYEWLQAKRGGMVYALFEGNKIKTALFKIVSVPLSFFLGWVAPGLFCWWLYPSFPTVSLIIAVVYYVLSVGWLAVVLCRRALYRLRGGKSLRQTAAELNTSMFNAYYELREATIHVPSLRRAVEQAKEKGVGWDPQLFCVLDNVAQKNPSTWTVNFS
jgi:hypothetical protein